MMKKMLLLLTFLLQFQAWAVNIQGQEVLDNGELWQQENFMKNSLEKNIEALNKISKSPIYDSCPSQRLPDGSNDQTNIVTSLSKFVGNFQFWSYNTKSFYTKNEYNTMPCEMDVTLLLHNFPEHLRNPNEDSVYWNKELIAQRWKVASQSFKDCGIRIRNLTLTSFEFQGPKSDRYPNGRYIDQKPDYDLSTAIKKIIPAPFHENDQKRGSKSVIIAYVNDISEGEATPPQRGDRKYPIAAIESNTVFIRRDAIYIPIFPKGIPEDHPGFVVEAHEVGGHLLTGEEDKESHFNTYLDPNRYGVMSDMWSRASGKFIDNRCSKIIERGKESGYLRCSMKYAKVESATNTR